MPTLFDILNLNKRTLVQPQKMFTDVAETDFMISAVKEYVDNQLLQNQNMMKYKIDG